MKPGYIVKTQCRILGPQLVERGTRGKVLETQGDWVRIELPSGGRFEAHTNDLTVILKRDLTDL